MSCYSRLTGCVRTVVPAPVEVPQLWQMWEFWYVGLPCQCHVQTTGSFENWCVAERVLTHAQVAALSLGLDITLCSTYLTVGFNYLQGSILFYLWYLIYLRGLQCYLVFYSIQLGPPVLTLLKHPTSILTLGSRETNRLWCYQMSAWRFGAIKPHHLPH